MIMVPDPSVLEIRDGRITCEGQDCIDNMRSAYDNDTEMISRIDEFEKKWYKQEEKEGKYEV